MPWGVDLSVKMPITMGTVPFRHSYGNPLPGNVQVPSKFLVFKPPQFIAHEVSVMLIFTRTFIFDFLLNLLVSIFSDLTPKD